VRFTLAVAAKKEISEKEAPKSSCQPTLDRLTARKTQQRRDINSNTPTPTQRTMEAPPKPNTTVAAAATLDFGSALVFVPDHDEQEDIYEG
jgi:hypothetical protein